MRLGEKQELFALLIAEHIIWLYKKGYKCRLGDFMAHDRHKKNSNHYIKLAGDINLFKDDDFLMETEEHRESGEKWETRHELCSWGGRYQDGNHYSLEHQGRR